MAALSPAVVDARVGVHASGWKEAIRAASQPLLDADAISSHYVDRCVEMVDAHGPYMVLAPGVALAHARPEDGVSALCLSVGVLSGGVDFGHQDNDPVDVVFSFGSPDSDQHVGLLATLAEALQQGLADRLRSAPDRDSALGILEEVLSGV